MPEIRPIIMSELQYDAALKAGETTLADVLRTAKRLGVDGVELRDVYWKDKAADLDVARRLRDELGLLLTYATFATLFPKEAGEDPSRPEVRQAIDDAAALGSPLVRLFPGLAPADAGDPAWERARLLVHEAESRGVVIALENFAGTPGRRLDEIQAVLDRIPSPALGTNVDVGNYAANGQDPVAAIQALGSRVVYTHLKDNLRTPQGATTTALGDGDLPMPAILAALRQLPAPLIYCFEFAGGGAPDGRIARSLDYVRRSDSSG